MCLDYKQEALILCIFSVFAHVAARRPQELAALSEAHYHDQIESIADEVLAAGQRIVMLTGPSAAGKTTSAHKIADAIAARGHRSQVISLDDFYIGEGKYPKNPDGIVDWQQSSRQNFPWKM